MDKDETARLKDAERMLLEKVCDRYLHSLHCTLWGQPFEIISPKGRAQAVQWLADTLETMARMEERRV